VLRSRRAQPSRPDNRAVRVGGDREGDRSVAIGAEAAEADVGRRSPRPPAEGIITRALGTEIALLAAVMTAAGLTLAGWGATGRDWQSMLFASLALAQLGLAASTRSALLPLWRLRWSTNPMLGYAVTASALLTLAGLYLPPLAELLHIRPLTAAELAAALLAAAVPTAVFEVLKAWRRHHGGGPSRVTTSRVTGRSPLGARMKDA
jgi:Ca2+-transporting ATPase